LPTIVADFGRKPKHPVLLIKLDHRKLQIDVIFERSYREHSQKEDEPPSAHLIQSVATHAKIGEICRWLPNLAHEFLPSKTRALNRRKIGLRKH